MTQDFHEGGLALATHYHVDTPIGERVLDGVGVIEAAGNDEAVRMEPLDEAGGAETFVGRNGFLADAQDIDALFAKNALEGLPSPVKGRRIDDLYLCFRKFTPGSRGKRH
jgi:hypothetical protein